MRTIQRSEVESDRSLQVAAAVFTAVVLFHNGDHVRRGAEAVSSDVFWAGSASIVLEVGIVVLILLGHRLAPLAAAASGFALAAGYVLVHLLPPRGWLSDALFSGGAEAISQVAALTEVAGALLLGVAGWSALRRRGGPVSATEDVPLRPWSAVLTNPVVLAMGLGNAVIFVVSIADR